MRVIAFMGSPRKNGSTDKLVKQILAGATSAGAQTEEFFLNDLNIRGCQACMYCKSHIECSQKDNMPPLTEEIKRADRLVFAAPIYMGGINAQSKTFLDRLYAFGTAENQPGKMPTGKKAALMFSHASPDENSFCQNVEPIARFLERLGVKITDTLFAAGGPKALDDEGFMQRVFQAGVDLVQ
ncbi:flavodoxin family protein [Marasmitruncus massiliensis]|uniref:flavodoxin family protein n=1 Tax=Marasmitruncus massiliensis TaxID=1944642 RepID=UPI0015E0B4E8|nr:flavodoxin family protein [Marasmitruncus massiliensis]